MLAIWGAAGGIPAETEGPLATWREWATDVRGFPIDSGHYLAEEAPDATARALLEFFAGKSRTPSRRSRARPLSSPRMTTPDRSTGDIFRRQARGGRARHR